MANRRATLPGPFAGNLRLLMVARKVSDVELAARMGFSLKKARRFLIEESRPRLEDLPRLALILSIAPELLAWCPTAELREQLGAFRG